MKSKSISGNFLIELLQEKQLISADELERINKIHKSSNLDLQRIILQQEIMGKNELMLAVAEEIRTKYVDLKDVEIDPGIAALIPEEMSRRHQIIALDKEENILTVAMANPLDVFAQDEIKIRLGYEIDSVLAFGEDINEKLNEVFGQSEDWEKVVDKVENVEVTVLKEEIEKDEDISAISKGEEAPIIALVNLIMLRAIKEKASDIHIEPFDQKHLKIRFRIDGILQDVMSLSSKLHLPVISRIKIMSELDIAERRLPQDGRIQVKASGRKINIRVSTIPTVNGESAVLRILDPSSILLDLDALGFSEAILPKFKSLIKKPNGIILVTGPTGSGKSTTLYTVLNLLNSTEKKIMTIEDPVEYRLKGISQIQARPKIGLTFAAGLRSFLRQDPDIMLVGEIRDKETAEIAVQAALTGHMVLSTLHTNDAPSSVVRLVDMGLESFLISASVVGVLAQRLVRKICPKCMGKIGKTQKERKTLMNFGVDPEKVELYRGAGCPYCNDSGYKGRVAIFELMLISDNIKNLISKHADTKLLREEALKEGMKLLSEDGLEKACLGITTLDEILRTTST